MTTHPSHPMRSIVLVTCSLMLILAATAALSIFDLGRVGLVIALLLASIKGVLVATQFMNLRLESATVRFVALSGLLWFGLMLAGILADALTRPGVSLTSP
jgi:caa(3)-type oxidase subunit IV